MKGIIFVDQKSRDEIAAVIKYAEENHYTMDDALDMVNNDFNDRRDSSKMEILIPINITLRYSITTNLDGQLNRVLSILHPTELVPPPIVEIFAKEYFKFIGGLCDWYVQCHEADADKPAIIHLACKF